MSVQLTVEESNLISIYESKRRTKVMRDICKAMKHWEDEGMLALSVQTVGKLECLSDEEFAQMEFVAAE